MRLVLLLFVLAGQACADAKDASSSGLTPPPEEKPPLQTAGIHRKCLPGKSWTTKLVTHYYVPLLEAYDHFTCDQMEGTCIYKKNGVQWLHNFGYTDQPLADARCKNGYGNRQNCLNPCRTIAASTVHHRTGEVFFIKDLVGKRCGNMARDGYEMIHDGFVVVGDTGSPNHFNERGRFDFFWGRCRNKKNGVCHEGATDITNDITNSSYCMVWNPADPLKNQDVKLEFTQKVRDEAIEREDYGAAADFDLDKYIGTTSN
ncbi:MAG: hypothetical protein AB7F86_18895 [Bdellovibrionales bacterium]